MAKHDVFDYVTTGAIAASAVFTGAMALFTRTLGDKTQKSVAAATATAEAAQKEAAAVEEQVKVGRQELELSRRSLQAVSRPLLVNVPLGMFEETLDPDEFFVSRSGDAGEIVSALIQQNPATVWIRVPVRNIGAGPAIVQDAKIEAGPNRARCQPSNLVIAPGERSFFTFLVPQMTGAPPDASDSRNYAGPVRVEVEYTDASGELDLRAELNAPYESDGYVVRSLMLRERRPDGSFTDPITSQV